MDPTAIPLQQGQNHTFPGVYTNRGLLKYSADGVVVPEPTTPQVADPVITPPSGSFLTTIMVTITEATAGATVYYTTDGSQPGTGSSVYTGPFLVPANTIVQAIAKKQDYLNSNVVSANYVNSIIQVTPAILDFGTISFLGGPLTGNFTVTNLGTNPLSLLQGSGSLTGSDRFFITAGTNYSLGPLASSTFTVEWEPNVGGVAYTSTATFTGGANGPVSTRIFAHTSPPQALIQVKPPYLDFGTVTPSMGTYSQNFTVTNIGDATLTGSATVANGTQFIVFSGSNYSLAPGQSQIATVVFQPNSAGANDSTIVNFSGGNGTYAPVFGETNIPGPIWNSSSVRAGDNWAIRTGDFGGTFPPVATDPTNLGNVGIGFNGTAAVTLSGALSFNQCTADGSWTLNNLYTGPAAHVAYVIIIGTIGNMQNQALQIRQDGATIFSSFGQGGPGFQPNIAVAGTYAGSFFTTAGNNSFFDLILQAGCVGPGNSAWNMSLNLQNIP